MRMNTLRNSVRLIGNLGMDPEVKDVKSNQKMARFSLATTEAYKNQKGEVIKETTWHNLVAWGKPAMVVEKMLYKGCEIAIEGKLHSRSYTDREGQKRYITEVVVNSILVVKQPR